MFGKRYDLITVFGVTLRIDASWLVVAALVSWLLADSFSVSNPDLSTMTHWLMGLAGALGLFGSVVLHEFGHALVAQRVGLSIRGITLFFFGGVAEMDTEPPGPVAEFLVAVAGPAVTIVVGGICFVLSSVSLATGGYSALTGILGYLAMMNLYLLAFNMVPAFPLDGGRVLRSLLWYWKRDLTWATSIAARIGRGFGTVLIALGVFDVIARQDLVGGVWLGMIGLFLRNAAQTSYRQVLLQRNLTGSPVGDYMRTDVATVPRAASVAELVQSYVYRYRYDLFPVVDNEQLIGCVGAAQIQQLPQAEWARQSVGTIAIPCSSSNTVPPDFDAGAALDLMRRSGHPVLMVADQQRFLGMVTLQDLFRVSALKTRLETKAKS